jgi:hypothetical protein
MPSTDVTKLIGGHYRMPRCKVGRTLRCLRRGAVKVCGIHEALIQWPYTLPRTQGGRPILILCGHLARAVRTESISAGQGPPAWHDVRFRGGKTYSIVKRREAPVDTEDPLF